MPTGFMVLLLLVPFIILCSILPQAVAADIQPNFLYANSTKSFTGSAFEENLNKVFEFLLNTAPVNNGYAAYSYGNRSDTVYGQSECYKLAQGDCGQCLISARDIIKEGAPLAVGARYWINNSSELGDGSGAQYKCYLRYENYRFNSGMYLASLYTEPPVGASPSVLPVSSTKKSKTGIIIGAVLGGVAFCAILILATCFRFYKPRKLPRQHDAKEELERSFEGATAFKLEELSIATGGFSQQNKLGQGGFGPVYKGTLKNGTTVAIKQLSLQSQQGKQQFVNEVTIITGIQHRNLVTLNGYCIDRDQRLLVYEFLENKSLDISLFDGKQGVFLGWPERHNIIMGIARGLAYLHEESHVKIVHRDIKASNILLDKNLNPKISDFGISKLFDSDDSFLSTRVAGTYGYLAPEYAIWGKFTAKVDTFSFGVLALEIVSGRKCNDPKLSDEKQILLEWTWELNEGGRLLDLVDSRLDSDYSETEIVRAISVALLCTHEDPPQRPTMSEVVAMLLGYLELSPLPSRRPRYLAEKRMTMSSSETTEVISNLEPR